MSDDLVAEEVKIDPGVRAATFRKPEDPTIETPRFLNVANRECDMEGAYCGHRVFLCDAQSRRLGAAMREAEQPSNTWDLHLNAAMTIPVAG